MKQPQVSGSLSYKDVFLIPKYSEVSSRSLVDTSITLPNGWVLDVPVISANMDTVTEEAMAQAMRKGGGLGALHRFSSVQRNAEMYANVGMECFVSIGVNEESKERAKTLFILGARAFVVDVAHGHSKLMKDMVEWLRKSFGTEITIMAGNVATAAAVIDLISWGVDILKVGIGPGEVCTTKNVTGVTVPQFSAVETCASQRDALAKNGRVFNGKRIHKRPLIVADGGISEIGDIAKALCAGADLVMCGRMFADCLEAPGERIGNSKVYRGMASQDAMLTIKPNTSSLPTAEGVSTLIPVSNLSAVNVLANIKGGLQSAFSYSNAKTLKEFQLQSSYGVRYTQMK